MEVLVYQICQAPSAIRAKSPPRCQNDDPSAYTSSWEEEEVVESRIRRRGGKGSDNRVDVGEKTRFHHTDLL